MSDNEVFYFKVQYDIVSALMTRAHDPGCHRCQIDMSLVVFLPFVLDAWTDAMEHHFTEFYGEEPATEDLAEEDIQWCSRVRQVASLLAEASALHVEGHSTTPPNER